MKAYSAGAKLVFGASHLQQQGLHQIIGFIPSRLIIYDLLQKIG